MTDNVDHEAEDAFTSARQSWKGFDSTPKAKRSREKKVSETVNKRSLRATGRTAIFSFRARENLIDEFKRYAQKREMSIAELMESLMMAAIDDPGGAP